MILGTATLAESSSLFGVGQAVLYYKLSMEGSHIGVGAHTIGLASREPPTRPGCRH